ncbi:hypothetical protein GCM10010207_23730 [Streptomyces atratus]|nr:hypothetical protein GCM10010207_23730 [Streptomyces atratus]
MLRWPVTPMRFTDLEPPEVSAGGVPEGIPPGGTASAPVCSCMTDLPHILSKAAG